MNLKLPGSVSHCVNNEFTAEELQFSAPIQVNHLLVWQASTLLMKPVLTWSYTDPGDTLCLCKQPSESCATPEFALWLLCYQLQAVSDCSPEPRKANAPVWSAQFAVSQCSQPKWWTRRVRSKGESPRIAFLFDQVHWTPRWLKSQGFLGGCKAQPWQPEHPLSLGPPWRNNSGTMQPFSLGAQSHLLQMAARNSSSR